MKTTLSAIIFIILLVLAIMWSFDNNLFADYLAIKVNAYPVLFGSGLLFSGFGVVYGLAVRK